MGTGCAKLIIDLFGCFLPSFSVHHSPLHLLTLRNWGRGVCRGEGQKNMRWTREKISWLRAERNQQGGEDKPETVTGWRWWRKTKRKKPEETQAEYCCFVVVLGRDPQSLGTTILLQSAMVCRTHWTAWALEGQNNLPWLPTSTQSRALDGKGRGLTHPGQHGQRVL